MMVMRLDGARPQQVRDIISASIEVEKKGLRGKVVLDSRGIPARTRSGTPDGFGQYDQTLRDLGALLKSKTELKVVLDEKPDLLPPNSVDDVAIYCGWYSLRNYVPCVRFVKGAVGFHVASFELISLRIETEKGWVRGLLNDGVVATLGSVAEPYLSAFPAADDFFPLLLSGKLSLAEVYWKTTPLASWKMTMIGDPLYNPYEKVPALKLEDLPQRLRQGM
jgi:uncharacterized protein (TIGR03790 family)